MALIGYAAIARVTAELKAAIIFIAIVLTLTLGYYLYSRAMDRRRLRSLGLGFPCVTLEEVERSMALMYEAGFIMGIDDSRRVFIDANRWAQCSDPEKEIAARVLTLWLRKQGVTDTRFVVCDYKSMRRLARGSVKRGHTLM